MEPTSYRWIYIVNKYFIYVIFVKAKTNNTQLINKET